MSSSRMTHFFKAAHSDESLLLAGKEATFVHHAAIYGQSFKSSDYKLQASFKNFKPKFAIARTKCESVIANCIASMVAAELCQYLDKVNFISLTVDVSNGNEQGRWRTGIVTEALPPCTFIRGTTRCLFIRVISNFMFYQNRLEIYLLQLFAHPDTSE